MVDTAQELRRLIPKKGWLPTFVKYAYGDLDHPNTEIPLSFTYFTGLLCIAATLKRNVFLTRGIYNVYPGLLVVLVAPTGKGKKTTVASMGISLLREAGTARIISEKITPEALVVALKREVPTMQAIGNKRQLVPKELDACAMIYAPELAVFFDKRDYSAGLIPLITRLADCPADWSSETIMRSEIRLTNVALTMLGCSNPTWLTCIPGDAHGGGFVARLLVVYEEGAKVPVAIPKAPPANLRDELVKGLLRINRLKGQMKLSAKAEQAHVAWYDKAFHNRSKEEKRAAYEERKADHIYRLAICHAASEERMNVTLDDINRSLAVLNLIESKMFEVYDELDRKSTADGWAIDMVLKRVRGRGRISHTDLLRGCIGKGLRKDVVMMCVHSLVDAGLIKIEVTKGRRGPKAKYYLYTGGDQTNDTPP